MADEVCSRHGQPIIITRSEIVSGRKLKLCTVCVLDPEVKKAEERRENKERDEKILRELGLIHD